MDFPWGIFVDIGVISLALLIATAIRANVRFFQKYLIPNALTAGFLILPFYNFVAPHFGMHNERLGALVYHLLSVSFISMTLRKTVGTKKKGKNIFGHSVSIIFQYALQALLGLFLTLFFIKTFIPDLFPSFGFFLPLGFALGPGQAFAIGKGWEAFGFRGASSVGLTFAAVGFIWACFGGVFLINYGIRKGWMKKEHVEALQKQRIKTGLVSRNMKPPVGARLTTESEAIDSFTYNSAMVLIVYMLSFFLLKFLTWLLSFAGSAGHDLAVNLWGISFVFAALTALVFKGILKLLKVEYTLDNGNLTRFSGLSVDFMVAASVGAISLVVVLEYWIPILVICILGGIIIMTTIPWFCSRIFTDHRFHRTLIVYGACTGTMPTGLALLRVIDPEFETPAAMDYMYSTAITFMIVIPFILAINLPAYSYTKGDPIYFWMAIGVAFCYLIFALVSFRIIAKQRAFNGALRVWFREHLLHKK